MERDEVPDWKREIGKRLTSINLEPTREAEIIAELAQHLDDRYNELLASGTTVEQATREVLAELSDSALLARELTGVERIYTTTPVPLGARKANLISDFWQDLRYA